MSTPLARLGVEVVEDRHGGEAVEPGRVCWDGGQREADLVVWAAGRIPSHLGRQVYRGMLEGRWPTSCVCVRSVPARRTAAKVRRGA